MTVSFEQPPFCLMTEERIKFVLAGLEKMAASDKLNALIREANICLEQKDFLSEQPLLQISWHNAEKLEDFSLFNKVPFARPIAPTSNEKVLLGYNYITVENTGNLTVILTETEDTFERFYLAGKNNAYYFDNKTNIKAFDDQTEWYFPLPDEIAMRTLMYADETEIEEQSEDKELLDGYSQCFLINDFDKNKFYRWQNEGDKKFEKLNRLGLFFREIGNPVVAGKYLKLLS